MVEETAVGNREGAGEPAVAPLLEPPLTGDQAVDDAVHRLAGLAGSPLEDRPAVFEAVHRALTDRLADVEG